MTGDQIQAIYFNPVMFFIYLFVVFILMVAYYQWKWHKKADREVKLLVYESDGSSTTHYVPKTSTHVSITNPKTGVTKSWPFTDVCAIEMLYPGDGFLPEFVQKKIRTLIVDANDWEPLLNRGAYSENVASPDVKIQIQMFAATLPVDSDARLHLLSLAEGLKTAPTRKMIGSPTVLGNIANEKVSELAVTVAKDIMNPLQEAIKKLGKQISPTVTYVGMGLIIILLVYLVLQIKSITDMDVSGIADLASDVDKIKAALGVK